MSVRCGVGVFACVRMFQLHTQRATDALQNIHHIFVRRKYLLLQKREEVVQKSPFRQSEIISLNTRKKQVISLHWPPSCSLPYCLDRETISDINLPALLTTQGSFKIAVSSKCLFWITGIDFWKLTCFTYTIKYN